MSQSHRYELKTATWIVKRNPDEPTPHKLDSPQASARLAHDLAQEQDDDKEHFWVILVNRKLDYLMHTLVSTGSQIASIVHPREVFGPALREGATGIIVVHNHPTGDPHPSPEDRTITKRLVDAGELLWIIVHDHVIVGNGTSAYFSMSQEGMLVGNSVVA